MFEGGDTLLTCNQTGMQMIEKEVELLASLLDSFASFYLLMFKRKISAYKTFICYVTTAGDFTMLENNYLKISAKAAPIIGDTIDVSVPEQISIELKLTIALKYDGWTH
jgi:hypothetical protein